MSTWRGKKKKKLTLTCLYKSRSKLLGLDTLCQHPLNHIRVELGRRAHHRYMGQQWYRIDGTRERGGGSWRYHGGCVVSSGARPEALLVLA